MRLILALVVSLICIHDGSGYFFPLCISKNDKSCVNYFNFPTFSISSFNFFTQNHEEEKISEVEVSKQVELPFGFDNLINPITVFYQENAQPTVSKFFKLVVEYMPVLRDKCLGLIPFFKEKKVKADSRLYLLFVVTSVTIYLGLYIYFTRKLYYYYKGTLRQQYLDNVKKIFKSKD